MEMIFLFILAYFIGAIPTAFWTGKLLKNIDIRQHGSGNSGATNAFRVLGKGPGTAVFAIDLFKGAAAVLIFLAVTKNGAPPIYALFIGFTAVLGHVFTPFLGFKGGKGVATGAGVLLATYPILFAVTLGVWIVFFMVSRIVSLSSLVAASALFVSGLFLVQDAQVRTAFALMTIFVFWTHRANIGRLLRGEEKKIVNSNK